MKVAIIGAGNGGLAAAVELSQKGFTVSLWNRSPEIIKILRSNRGIKYTGVLGDGFVAPDVISTDVEEVTQSCDVLLICLPTYALGSIANLLIDVNLIDKPVILNPGHTGGALEFSQVFRERSVEMPPVSEFSTLTYVARQKEPGFVNVTGAAKHIWVGKMPGGVEAQKMALELFPNAEEAGDVLATSLANVNMVLHPPGAILGLSWVESTEGDFTFYVEGLTKSVGEVMNQLDHERLGVAKAFGHDLPDLFSEMKLIGTVEKDAKRQEGLVAAIQSGKANRAIKAPDSIKHRYYQEDFYYGLMPFLELAKIAEVEVPVATSLMTLGRTLQAEEGEVTGRTAHKMGIDGMNRSDLLNYLKN